MNNLLTLARRRPLIAFALAMLVWLGTPWQPAPWETPLGAQAGITQATSTTLAAAVTTSSANTISVTSATGFTVNNYLYVVGSNEAMRIRAINGTTITVLRGQLGTFARAHPSSSLVVTGVVNFFKNVDPDFNGTCTVGNAAPGLDASFGPWINVLTGNIWHCNLAGAWVGTYRGNITFNSVQLTR